MVDLDIKGRTVSELLLLKDQIKISSIAVPDKERLLNKIDSALGLKYTREDVLRAIKEGEADIDDITE